MEKRALSDDDEDECFHKKPKIPALTTEAITTLLPPEKLLDLYNALELKYAE